MGNLSNVGFKINLDRFRCTKYFFKYRCGLVGCDCDACNFIFDILHSICT